MHRKDSFQKGISFLRARARYFLVAIFLAGAFFYNQKIVPRVEVSRSAPEAEETVSAEENTAAPEEGGLPKDGVIKKYDNAFQSLPGDAYRLKVSLRVDQMQKIQVYMADAFQREIRLGEIAVEPSKGYQSKELVFSTPGRYEDIFFKLEENEGGDGDVWQNRNVYIDTFQLSRLEAGAKGLPALSPTIANVAGLPQAKIEDLGGSYSYDFSLQGSAIDFQTLYEVSNSIRFDETEGLVIGSKKEGEYFTYKVDTLYPLQEAFIRAEQFGDAPKQLLVEYSFDDKKWQEVPYTQKEKGPQIFSGVLKGEGSRFLYIRVRYNAEEKRSGIFALDSLSLKAFLKKVK